MTKGRVGLIERFVCDNCGETLYRCDECGTKFNSGMRIECCHGVHLCLRCANNEELTMGLSW